MAGRPAAPRFIVPEGDILDDNAIFNILLAMVGVHTVILKHGEVVCIPTVLLFIKSILWTPMITRYTPNQLKICG